MRSRPQQTRGGNWVTPRGSVRARGLSCSLRAGRESGEGTCLAGSSVGFQPFEPGSSDRGPLPLALGLSAHATCRVLLCSTKLTCLSFLRSSAV